MATTYTQIGSTVTVGSGGASSIDFTSIPSTYTDLVVKISARTNRALYSDWIKVRFNGSTSSYTFREIEGIGTSANSYSGTGELGVYTNGDDVTANTFGNAELYIPNYAGSTYKSMSADGVGENNNTNAIAVLNAFLWSNIAAINQITLLPNAGTLFMQYSTASLYGIKKD